MRKFKTRSPRSLPFRLLVILAGALLLLAAFAPRANADLLRFYDFEPPPDPPYSTNLLSHAPALETGAFTHLTLESTTNQVPYPGINTILGPATQLNLPVGAPASTQSLGIQRAGVTNLNMEIPFISATGIYDIDTISVAVGTNGNGFQQIALEMSTDGGLTFPTQIGPIQNLTALSVITFTIPDGTTINIPNLVLRLHFLNGQSNGANLQTAIDNLTVNGTAVPEPATVAGGLLGVLGLCWQQRRRLIGALRLRRT